MKKKFILGFIVLIFSADNFAQSLLLPSYLPLLRTKQFPQQRIFKISSGSTNDSSVQISSSAVNPGTKWLWIRVTKGQDAIDSIYPVTAPLIKKKAYLSQGPGIYQLDVFLSDQQSRFNGRYGYAARFEVVNTDQRENMDALLPTTDIQSDSQVIVDLVDSITQGLANDLDKSTAIHDYVAGQIVYDAKAFIDGSYKLNDHDALLTLYMKTAVCEGYSNLTAALHRAAGIPARKIIGEGIQNGSIFTGVINHAWNEVLIDGKWILIDTTWDAGYLNSNNEFVPQFSRKYFNTEPAEFYETHKKLSRPLPKAEAV